MANAQALLAPVAAGSVSRGVLAAIGAVVIALALFLGMKLMISMGQQEARSTDDLAGVDFIRLKRDETIEVKQREKEKPPPPKKPPPPLKLDVKQNAKPQTQPLNIDMPRMDASLRMGGGPFLGTFGSRAISGDGEAIPVVAIAPPYPRQAAIQKIEGFVTLEFEIEPDGSVSNPRIVAADPARVFSQAALRAITRWKFKPTVIDGKPVRDSGRYTLKFKLSE
jgi:protein TonB